MKLRRMSNAVGGFVQRTLRKASSPWKVVRAQRPLSTPSTLSKRFIGKSSLINDEAGSNVPQVSQADETATGSLPDFHPGSSVCSVPMEQTETPNSPPYTDGPSQIILANDGTKNCLALLLTKGMVTDLNEINETRQKLEIAEGKYENIRRQVKINEIFVDQSHANLQVSKSEEERSRTLKEIEECKEILLKDTKIKETLEEDVSIEKRNLHYMQALSQTTFQKLFTDAGLASLPEPDTAANPEDQEAITSRANSVTPSDGTGSVISLEQLHKQYVLENLTQTRTDFVDLQTAFDERKETYETDLQEYNQWVLEGRTTATKSEFDTSCLKDAGAIARALIDAENEYETALTEARALDLLDTTSDQESNFGDGIDDGYSLSFEVEMRAAPDRDFIDRWNDTVTENESTELLKCEGMNSDSWEVQSVAMSDSFSVLNHSRGRRRIDRWQAICDLQREESESLRKETVQSDLFDRS